MKTIISPCIHICKIENNLCIGCKRTSREISEWLMYSDEQRQAIMDRLNGDTTTNGIVRTLKSDRCR